MPYIPLTRGFKTLVDDEDYEAMSAFNWCASRADKHVYAVRGIGPKGKTKLVLMHRVITNAPADMLVDHANGDTLDNRRSNLRLCLRWQNNGNQRRPKKRLVPLPPGVFQLKGSNRFYARGQCQERRYSLGGHATVEEAHRAVIDFSLKMLGEFSPHFKKEETA